MGDRIEIPADELKGRVIDLNLLFTTLREEDGSLLQVPNNFFFQKAIRRIPGKHKMELAEQLKRDVPAE
jgi:small-conductance mechanosensitive channel